MFTPHFYLSTVLLTLLVAPAFAQELGNAAQPNPWRSVSGIYPHLAMFNNEGECGTGAVVPWGNRLWVLTYAPHMPKGSSDKLYEITPDFQQIIRPESVGGTPANRMIHRESKQLFIGPYAISAEGNVRTIPYAKMFGRHTGNARHLFQPAEKIYFATMEEGLYEVDVKTLEVKELWTDEQQKTGRHANLPGYHGKGLYSGQGRIVYANNGEHGAEAQKRPDVPSGVLADWDGQAEKWNIVRRNQFTEVTGPGGIYGNENPATDPIWSIGWDHRSLILQVLHASKWHSYRLPKGSHSYDGAHGWNTEWPRIRDIGEESLLMTMHGTFWKFPKTFSPDQSAGITPRSNYLKVIGDFCRWQERVVLGCDDTAKNEFLNKRAAKGNIAGPGRSQSNLWFVEPRLIDTLGPALGRGAVWLNETVAANRASDPYLFAGYAQRSVHLAHTGKEGVKVNVEVDVAGNGRWTKLKEIELPPSGAKWVNFKSEEVGTWIRFAVDRETTGVTAYFQYQNADSRPNEATVKFAPLAKPGDPNVTGGLLHARGAEFKTLRFVANDPTKELGCYDLDANLQLKKVNDPEGLEWTKKSVAIPTKVLAVDAASVVYVDDRGRWRLPLGDAAFAEPGPLGPERVCREVCTERDLFNAHGTFYELPADNAGGFAKVRPVATHNRRIKDYASYRGLLVLSGLQTKEAASEHVIRSDDGLCSLWVGAVDDLWQLGKPRGRGGPWKETAVKANEPSDPYLMTGYDRKRLTLSHQSAEPVTMTVEVDITGTGHWLPSLVAKVGPKEDFQHEFPIGFSAYWVRMRADRDTTATAWLVYE